MPGNPDPRSDSSVADVAAARRVVREVGALFDCAPAGADDVAIYAALVAKTRWRPASAAI